MGSLTSEQVQHICLCKEHAQFQDKLVALDCASVLASSYGVSLHTILSLWGADDSRMRQRVQKRKRQDFCNAGVEVDDILFEWDQCPWQKPLSTMPFTDPFA
jgi:hypothetical protein